MRCAISSCLLVAGLACAPAASAEPSPVVFTDNPAIVDPHPLRIESWAPADDDYAVVVQFTTGTPTCFGVHATAEETPEAVVIDLTGGTLPEAVGRPCIMIAVVGTLDVPLQSPLAGRPVLDKPR